MINKVSSFIDKYATPKEDLDIESIDYIRIKAANKLLISGYFIMAVLIIFNLYMGFYQVIIINILIIITLALSYKFNQKGKSNIGIPLSTISCIIFAFLPALFMPIAPGSHSLFIALVGTPIILIDKKQPKLRFLGIGLCFLFYILIEYYIPSNHTLDEENKAYSGIFWSVISFILIISQYKFWEEINISARKKLIEQQALLLESNQLSNLGVMSAGIAHEINNPLSIIQGHIDKLKRKSKSLAKEDGESILVGLEKQTDAVERIGKIINGLRVLSRDGSNDKMLPEKVKEILDETVNFCKENANSKGINVTLDNQVPDEYIHCQRVQIGQVILNLIGNSIDAIEKQKSPWIKVKAEKINETIKLSFIDSGNGIPEDLAHKILTPFFTTKEIGKGTGLGLSLSLKIIEKHNGSLKIDKSCDHTCFVLEIPSYKIKQGLSA